MLDKIVTALDEIYDNMAQLHDADVRGDIYEYLLSKISTAGVNGQFRTPRHIIRMMVELLDPKPDDVICDKTTPRLLQSHALENAVKPPFLGNFFISGISAA